ncbi:hypothetical protein EVAR_88321_1 [Eumeta japonica]|uniref:Uncharacterized protein n=1 Tax=Eumeta variegata TaxID=151549 RepID=A0A4C1VNT3_EUMVA|nr:hypothetical protein EVAR_88321_1 [Eumeta japonica]
MCSLIVTRLPCPFASIALLRNLNSHLQSGETLLFRPIADGKLARRSCCTRAFLEDLNQARRSCWLFCQPASNEIYFQLRRASGPIASRSNDMIYIRPDRRTVGSPFGRADVFEARRILVFF